MDEDRYLCPICGNHIDKTPYADLSENGNPAMRRWNCQFCRQPLTAHFRRVKKRWVFDYYDAAPLKTRNDKNTTDRRTDKWRKNKTRKSKTPR